MKAYIAEFLGTFALVFFGTGAIVVNELTPGVITHIGIAITFGLVVMAVIYTFGDLSGAHINPAVTLTLATYKMFPAKEVLPYIVSQLTGAIAASGVLKLLFPASNNLGSTLPAGSISQSLILELILAFFLMFAIISVARKGKEKGLLAGLTIGSVVLLEAMVAGPVSGASMNPARSLGPALVSGQLTSVWIYLIAPIAGMSSAAGIHQLIKEK